LRHLKRLLLSVRLWYCWPLSIAWALLLGGAIRAKHGLPHPVFLVGYILLCVVLFIWGVPALNRRAVRRRLDPRIEELDRLLSQVSPES